MEKEASLLRCSKLSCYGEFNRMVQAISRNRAVTDIAPMQGTSAEYHFYTTLVIMLKGVINNPDQAAQRQELQQVYKWFCLNKPLIKSKTKPSYTKPKVSLTKKSDRKKVLYLDSEFDRPQTAPAVLDQPQNFTTFSASSWRRPHTSSHGNGIVPKAPSQRPTFTSSYVSRSLSKDLNLIGQPLDQLQLADRHSSATRHPASNGSPSTPSPSPELGEVTRTQKSLSIIPFPAPGFLAGYDPTRGQDFSDQRPATVGAVPVTIGAVFSMAPNIAAQMTLNREMNQYKMTMLQRRMQSPQPGFVPPNRRHMNTPNDLERAALPLPVRPSTSLELSNVDDDPRRETTNIEDSNTSLQNPVQTEEQVAVVTERKRVHVTVSAADHDLNESQTKDKYERIRASTADPIQSDSTQNRRVFDSKLQHGKTVLSLVEVQSTKANKHPSTAGRFSRHSSQPSLHHPDIGQLEIKGRTLHHHTYSHESTRQDPTPVVTMTIESDCENTDGNNGVNMNVSEKNIKRPASSESPVPTSPVLSTSHTSEDLLAKPEDQDELEKPVEFEDNKDSNQKSVSKEEDVVRANPTASEPPHTNVHSGTHHETPAVPQASNLDKLHDSEDTHASQPTADEVPTEEPVGKDSPTDTDEQTVTQISEESITEHDTASQILKPVESSISSEHSRLFESSTTNVPVSPSITIRSPTSPKEKTQRPLSSNSNLQKSLPMNVVSISFPPKDVLQPNTSSALGVTGITRKKGPHIHGAGFNKRMYQRRKTVDVPVT